MLDITFIREHPEVVKKAAADKNVDINVDDLLAVDDKRRKLQSQFDELSRQRKEVAGSGKPSKKTIAEGKALKEKAGELETLLKEAEERYFDLLRDVPNIPSEDTPVGPDESANVVLRQHGSQPSFAFTPKEHWELGRGLGVIDSERAAQVSGSRFAYLKGELVMLQFALVQLALSVLTDAKVLAGIAQEKGTDVPSTPFVPVLPPVLILPDVLERMARLEPKDDRYHIPSDDLYLVGSAEHTLGPLHMKETFSEGDLPRRYVGYSTSFRRESGSYGKDVRGILRLHQFDKLEIESFTTAATSAAEQDFIVAIQEHLMQQLGLPYQVVQISTGDMGGPDARQIDIETWLPGQDRYRETHTADLMTDYQARRLQTKVQRADGSREYVHMNDATVFAMGRMLIAIMENYQQEDGSVAVPEVLKKYVSFQMIEN